MQAEVTSANSGLQKSAFLQTGITTCDLGLHKFGSVILTTTKIGITGRYVPSKCQKTSTKVIKKTVLKNGRPKKTSKKTMLKMEVQNRPKKMVLEKVRKTFCSLLVLYNENRTRSVQY